MRREPAQTPAPGVARTPLHVAAVVAALVLPALAAGGDGAPPVRDRPLLSGRVDEVAPAGDGRWIAWAANRRAGASSFAVFARRGKRAHRVSVPPFAGRPGGISAGLLAYEVTGASVPGGSDIALYDLARRVHRPVPGSINTPAAERNPSLSGNRLVYERRIGSQTDVLVRDLRTGRQRILATSSPGCPVAAGQVSGRYAVFVRCRGVVLYDLVTRRDRWVSQPAFIDFAATTPAVASDGTVFHVIRRSVRRCGGERLVARRPNGVTLLVRAVPAGNLVGDAYAVSRREVLYEVRRRCVGRTDADVRRAVLPR